MSSPSQTTAPETFTVEPARLDGGTWCRVTEKQIGEGDIHAAYSADRIGMSQPVRKPFPYRGALWVCVSLAHRRGEERAEAYRLVPPQAFAGPTRTYAETARNSDDARRNPDGFYHGMRVCHAGTEMILSGPPALFIRGQAAQFDLFS